METFENVVKSDLGYVTSIQTVLLEECQQILETRTLSGANVLEIGCGHGNTTSQIVDTFPNVREVLGIDSNANAVDYAFTYVADEKMDFAKANLEEQTTFELTWAGKFDFVFATHTMLFVRDHTAALRNLMWCLKPGGKCFLAVPASKPEDFHSAVTKVLAAEYKKKDVKVAPDVLSDLAESNCNKLWFNHPHADRVYSALLEHVGYQVLNTKLIDFKYTFSSEDEYKECLQCLVHEALECLPEEKQETIFKQFCKAALKKAKKTSKSSLTWNVKYAIVLAKRPEQ